MNIEEIPLRRKNFQQNVRKKGTEAASIDLIEAGSDAAGKPVKSLVIQTGEK